MKISLLLEKVNKWLPIRIQKILSKLGWTGNRQYQKFVILARGRTGSNFLKGLLNSDNEIVCYGEMYRSADNDQDGKVIQKLKNDIWHGYAKAIKAVGFKIFYQHAHKGNNEQIWQNLLSNTSIKVIHLTRKNRLKTFLSREKAGATNVWANTSGRQEQKMQFTLNYEDVLKDFEQTEKNENEYREKFKEHNVYELVYENLSENTSSEIAKVLEFLGLEKRPLVASTYKQRSESLKDSIENYDELKSKFKGSKWEVFFEE